MEDPAILRSGRLEDEAQPDDQPGLRYEIMTGWSGVKRQQAVCDPAVTNFNVSSSAVNGIAPGAPVLGGMWYAFSGANGRTTLQAPKYDIVMPRVGFSWQVFNNMVVRGGIGVYSAQPGAKIPMARGWERLWQ